MTKRVELDEVPYNGIEVGEKVMYLSTSYGKTYMGYGFYRGMRWNVPVVEFYIKDIPWTLWGRFTSLKIISRRVFLKEGRVYSVKRISSLIDETPGPEDFIE